MNRNHLKSLFLVLLLALPAWGEEPAKPSPTPTPTPWPGSQSEVKQNDPPTDVHPAPANGWADGSGSSVTAPVPYSRGRSQIFAFQLNGIFLLQPGRGNSFTGQFSWTPQFKIDRYEMRLDLGVSVPKNSLGDLFLSVNYELLFRTRVNPDTRLDIGGGAMTWTGYRGLTKPVASAQLSRFYDIKSLVNQIFLGYSLFFAPNLIHIFKAGIGFTL